MCRSIAFRWEASGVPLDHVSDLQQVAREYEVAHEDDQYLIPDLRQLLNDVCAQWCFQTKRADNKGLRVLKNGMVDGSWLETLAPSPEGQALARVDLERLWQRLTPGEKRAVECLLLSDKHPNGSIVRRELAQFGIPSPQAYNQRITAVRRGGYRK